MVADHLVLVDHFLSIMNNVNHFKWSSSSNIYNHLQWSFYLLFFFFNDTCLNYYILCLLCIFGIVFNKISFHQDDLYFLSLNSVAADHLVLVHHFLSIMNNVNHFKWSSSSNIYNHLQWSFYLFIFFNDTCLNYYILCLLCIFGIVFNKIPFHEDALYFLSLNSVAADHLVLVHHFLSYPTQWRWLMAYIKTI